MKVRGPSPRTGAEHGRGVLSDAPEAVLAVLQAPAIHIDGSNGSIHRGTSVSILLAQNGKQELLDSFPLTGGLGFKAVDARLKSPVQISQFRELLFLLLDDLHGCGNFGNLLR
jgi:hypothetical protein